MVLSPFAHDRGSGGEAGSQTGRHGGRRRLTNSVIRPWLDTETAPCCSATRRTAARRLHSSRRRTDGRASKGCGCAYPSLSGPFPCTPASSHRAGDATRRLRCRLCGCGRVGATATRTIRSFRYRRGVPRPDPIRHRLRSAPLRSGHDAPHGTRMNA